MSIQRCVSGCWLFQKLVFILRHLQVSSSLFSNGSDKKQSHQNHYSLSVQTLSVQTRIEGVYEEYFKRLFDALGAEKYQLLISLAVVIPRKPLPEQLFCSSRGFENMLVAGYLELHVDFWRRRCPCSA
jgi:hypothetical protein